MEGFRKVWSYREFNAAWGSNYKDGQRDYSGVVCDLALPTANWDPQIEEQEPIYQLDPAMSRRIKAWASYHDIPEPEITGPAVANAYIEAMGAWGERTAEHEVGETDTLGLLALRYYDNPLKDATITLFNRLTATDTMHDEDMLTVPEPLERPVEIPDEERPIGGSTPHQDRIRLLNELKIEADRIPRFDYETALVRPPRLLWPAALGHASCCWMRGRRGY